MRVRCDSMEVSKIRCGALVGRDENQRKTEAGGETVSGASFGMVGRRVSCRRRKEIYGIITAMNNKHESYDLAFSLGDACACSVALRRADLQFASFPLDWIALGTPVSRATLVATRFAGWLEKDDFTYNGTNPVNALGMFDNRRTGLRHLHDFADCPIEKSYDAVREKYRRREARLYALAEKSRRILCAYISRPLVDPVPVEDLKEVKRLLSEAFPHAAVEIVHFANDPGRSLADRRSTTLADGIFQIEFDYHDPHRDVAVDLVAAALREEGFTVRDYRTKAEKREYELKKKMKKYGAKTRTGLLAARLRHNVARLFGFKPKSAAAKPNCGAHGGQAST